jgi:hypothetical protein
MRCLNQSNALKLPAAEEWAYEKSPLYSSQDDIDSAIQDAMWGNLCFHLPDGACGIYLLLNANNGRIYIGRSVNIGKRVKNHTFALRRMKHANMLMQSDFSDGNIDAFGSCVLTYTKPQHLFAAEHYALMTIRHMDTYNIQRSEFIKKAFLSDGYKALVENSGASDRVFQNVWTSEKKQELRKVGS